MSAAFRDYEADYQSQLDSIKKDINTIAHSLQQSEKKSGAVFNRHDIVKRMIEQHSHMKSSLAHMELESNEGTAEQRGQCKQRLAQMKKEAFRLEKEINRLKQESAAADRADLLRRAHASTSINSNGGKGAGDDKAPGKTDSQLAQMAENTGTMHRGTGTLTKALQYVVRMNEHGEATIVELKRQDETTDRVLGTAVSTDVELSGAQRILRDMKMTAMKNQIILSAVVILLIVMIVGLLYYRFGRPMFADDSSGDGTVGPPTVGTMAPSSPSSGGSGGGSAALLLTMPALDGFAPAPAGATIQALVP